MTHSASFGPVFVIVVFRKFVSITVVPIVLVDMISIEKKSTEKKTHLRARDVSCLEPCCCYPCYWAYYPCYCYPCCCCCYCWCCGGDAAMTTQTAVKNRCLGPLLCTLPPIWVPWGAGCGNDGCRGCRGQC